MSALTAKDTTPSGARLAPACDQPVCDGYRTWDTPAGPVDGHCGCATGRETAEVDYAHRHGSRRPS